MKHICPRRPLFLPILILCLAAFVSCGGATYRSDLTSASVMNTVTAAIPAEDGYAATSEGYINASMWGERYQALLDAVTDYTILISGDSAMNVDELGVFRVKEGGDVKAATAIVKEYVEAQALRHKGLLEAYNPDELPKTENRKVTVCGSYILYSILGNSETAKAHEAFEAALKMAKS